MNISKSKNAFQKSHGFTPLDNPRHLTGFTLLELMIVMSIIAILAVLGITGIRSGLKSSRDSQRTTIIKSIQIALESYKMANNIYPPTPGASEYPGNVYYLTCSPNCINPATSEKGPLNNYISGDLLDPTGPPYDFATFREPGNLKSGMNVPPQTYRYYYKRESNTTYTLRVATEAKLSNEPLNQADFDNWNNNGYYEDFSNF